MANDAFMRVSESVEGRTPYYPVFLALRNRKVLVVGGGSIAERKVTGLVQAGACVCVVSPKTTPRLEGWAAEGCIELKRRVFDSGDIQGMFLVYAATNDAAVNEAVYVKAESCGILVNVVDDPPHCNFIVPSVARRGLLQMAVSTSGAAPALAKRVRRELEERYSDEWEDYVNLLAEVRELVRLYIPNSEAERASVLEAACDLALLERIRAGVHLEAEAVYREAVAVAAGDRR